MKKQKKSTSVASRKAKAKPRKVRLSGPRGTRKRVVSRGAPRAARKARRTHEGLPAKTAASMQAHSAARMAASVLSRRAAKAEALAVPAATPRPPRKAHSVQPVPGSARQPRNSSARHGRAHSSGSAGGSRPGAKFARMPQFNYMKAPGADSGFDVGDGVEVLCDHEQEGERVRGWIKGVVVQVDNKLVAVQFRSNVFLTDGWMVPDRILWYSLGSDQIRNSALSKRSPQAVIPEY